MLGYDYVVVQSISVFVLHLLSFLNDRHTVKDCTSVFPMDFFPTMLFDRVSVQ